MKRDKAGLTRKSCGFIIHKYAGEGGRRKNMKVRLQFVKRRGKLFNLLSTLKTQTYRKYTQTLVYLRQCF